MRFIILCISIIFFEGSIQPVNAQKKVEISKSWRDPATLVKINQFNRVLVVALIKDDTIRTKVENDLVKLLKGKGFSSKVHLGADQADLTEEGITEKVKEAEFDCALVMQLYDPAKPLPYIPGVGTYPAQYRSFYSFFDAAANKFRDAQYLADVTNFAIESNFYSLKDNKLIWNATTTGIGEKDFEKLMGGVVKLITDELRKQGFLY